MRFLLGVFFALGFLTNAYAEVCEYSPPESTVLTYKKGEYLPVYFSEFQLDLPEAPSAFLASDGFIATYPDRGYVGIQHLDPAAMGDSLSRLFRHSGSVADYYRTIYSVSSAHDDRVEPVELSLQRRLLDLDCNSDVALYQLNDLQILFSGAKDAGDFHKIMLLDGNNVELITVRGTREVALRVVSSIKRRL